MSAADALRVDARWRICHVRHLGKRAKWGVRRVVNGVAQWVVNAQNMPILYTEAQALKVMKEMNCD